MTVVLLLELCKHGKDSAELKYREKRAKLFFQLIVALTDTDIS